MDLPQIVADFGEGLRLADARAPQAVSSRSGKAYSPGLGPHGENKAVALVMHEMGELNAYYRSAHPVPYPASRLRCDLGLGVGAVGVGGPGRLRRSTARTRTRLVHSGTEPRRDASSAMALLPPIRGSCRLAGTTSIYAPGYQYCCDSTGCYYSANPTNVISWGATTIQSGTWTPFGFLVYANCSFRFDNHLDYGGGGWVSNTGCT